RALAEQAEGLLVEAADDRLTAHVHATAHDLTEEEADRGLAGRLEEIWIDRWVRPGYRYASTESACDDYRAAFAGRGLKSGQDVRRAAEWVRRRPTGLHERLIAGLDGWLLAARRLRSAETDWLLGVLQAADDDGWRQGLRSAIARGDGAAVDRLAAD